MKTITYTITEAESNTIRKDFETKLAGHIADYRKHPEYYVAKPESDLLTTWKNLAKSYALFQQLVRDNLAYIEKSPDEDFLFSDYEGDVYSHEANPDIPKEELQRQRKNEYARFKRQGVFTRELFVLGDSLELSCGFIGDDFYGSGYDTDFYNTALKIISDKMPDYFKTLNGVIEL